MNEGHLIDLRGGSAKIGKAQSLCSFGRVMALRSVAVVEFFESLKAFQLLAL
jgi:hypothetical protein